MTSYTIWKRTATHSDVLAAVGAADVLRHLEPRIVELEDRFEVRLKSRLLPSDLEDVTPGFSYLEGSRKKAPAGRPKSRLASAADLTQAEVAIPAASATDGRMYSILGRMKAYGGPNRVILQFTKMGRAAWSRSIWEGLHGGRGFPFSCPLVQLFNPQSCRGYALLKPGGTNRSDKTKDRWAEPFLEWLRFRGYFEGSAGWFASGDLRLFCPVPADIPYERFAAAAAGLRELRLGGAAVKIDCRAVLALTRLLIEGAESYRRPCESIRTIQVTHYKDMGQAHTLMGMEQLALPDWFELQTSEHAERWLRTLEEHDTVVRRLADSHSDEFALLQQYRRTLQIRREDSLAEFVEFLRGYGMLLFKRRAQDHWRLPQFRLESEGPILQRDPNLRAVLRNPGFLAIAAAVRSSTVGAQAARSNGKVDHREIRYGLLGELCRAGSVGRRALLEEVFSFISAFNREAEWRRGGGLPSRRILREELEAFAMLLEHLPGKVPAGSLLCGLSACLPGKASEAEAEPQVLQAASA